MLDKRNCSCRLDTIIKIVKVNTSIATIMVAVLFLLNSCVNDTAEVAQVSVEDEGPREIQEDLTLTYSDSSRIKIKLIAARAENYPQLEEPTTVFPKGIDVRFYDENGLENSRLRANSAINYKNKNLWIATGDVVVVNKKGEQLNTEELFWDEKKGQIYSEVFSKISTKDQIIMGEGFEADQSFSSYQMDKITGQINLEDEQGIEDR